LEDRKPKSVGIWLRVSTEDQARGESPEHHEKRARYYAESKGWKVAEVYHLEAVSGKSVMGNPECQRMLKDIKKEHITGLIFSKLARLARNTKELLDFADLFRESEADLISLQESIDTSSPAGRLFYTMIAAMAQWEREEIASRVAASVPIRAKLGKPLGGSAPFGYQWKDKKLVINPKEAPIRKLIYDLFLQHRRMKRVARLLNEAGHRTRSGAKFGDATVRRMIEDPSAKGMRRANYTKSLGDGKGWELKSEDEWVFTEIDPIVSPEVWNQANQLLKDRQNGKRPAKKAVQLFGGLVWCQCGTKMYVLSNSPKYVCMKCRNKIPIEDLDGIFHEQLKDFLFSPQDIAKYIEGADQNIKGKEELVQTLLEDRAKVKVEMDKLYRLYQEGGISSKGFGDRNKPLEERLDQIGDQLPELQAEIDFLKIKLQSSDQIIQEAQDLYTRWLTLSHEDKRQIVENILDRITIRDKEVSKSDSDSPALRRPAPLPLRPDPSYDATLDAT
jgi:site-specific DNA recombinase